jgi:hypothetical protein
MSVNDNKRDACAAVKAMAANLGRPLRKSQYKNALKRTGRITDIDKICSSMFNAPRVLQP